MKFRLISKSNNIERNKRHVTSTVFSDGIGYITFSLFDAKPNLLASLVVDHVYAFQNVFVKQKKYYGSVKYSWTDEPPINQQLDLGVQNYSQLQVL